MLTLASKLKRDDGLKGSRTSAAASDSTRRVSVRDRLLVKGNVACAVLAALERGLARGFWDAKRPVAEQKYLFENSLTHNCSLLTMGGLRAVHRPWECSRGRPGVLPGSERSLPVLSLAAPRGGGGAGTTSAGL